MDIVEDNTEDSKEIKLTDDQKAFCLVNVENLSLGDMAKKLSNDPKQNGQTKLGRAIKAFLIANGAKFKTSKLEPQGKLELTAEQKTAIINNAGKMKNLEMTRMIYGDSKLTPLSREFRAVYEFAESISKNFVDASEEPAPEEYKVVKSVYNLIPLVNKHVSNPRDENAPLYDRDVSKLKTQDLRNLRALLSYMQTPRFEQEILKYNKQWERTLFESTFIGLIHDKSDLLREERESYLSLSSVIVQNISMRRYSQLLKTEVENSLASQDSDTKKLSQTLIEALDAAEKKIESGLETERKLIKELTGSRSERMKGRLSQTASIINLVDMWRDEEKRNELLEIAARQKQAERDQVTKLHNMASVVALIAGVTHDELTN